MVIPRKYCDLLPELFRNHVIRMFGFREGMWIARLPKMKFDGMKSKAAAARPCFECSLDADGHNRNSQFVRQNRRASLELRNVAIDGTRTLGKNQQNSA